MPSRLGGKKLLSILQKRQPNWPWPARSTVCDILSRNGLVPKQRQRRRIGHRGKPTTSILCAPQVFSAFQFRWTLAMSHARGGAPGVPKAESCNCAVTHRRDASPQGLFF